MNNGFLWLIALFYTGMPSLKIDGTELITASFRLSMIPTVMCLKNSSSEPVCFNKNKVKHSNFCYVRCNAKRLIIQAVKCMHDFAYPSIHLLISYFIYKFL